MLPNNEVRLPPPRAARAAQSAAVPCDITTQFTEAASSELLDYLSGLRFRSDYWISYRAQDRTARQR
jgi:hypothetical protein